MAGPMPGPLILISFPQTRNFSGALTTQPTTTLPGLPRGWGWPRDQVPAGGCEWKGCGKHLGRGLERRSTWQSCRLCCELDVRRSVAFLCTDNEQVEFEIKNVIPLTGAPPKAKHLGVRLTRHVEDLHGEKFQTLMRGTRELNE